MNSSRVKNPEFLSSSCLISDILNASIPFKSFFSLLRYFSISIAGESEATLKLSNIFLMNGSSLCELMVDLSTA